MICRTAEFAVSAWRVGCPHCHSLQLQVWVSSQQWHRLLPHFSCFHCWIELSSSHGCCIRRRPLVAWTGHHCLPRRWRSTSLKSNTSPGGLTERSFSPFWEMSLSGIPIFSWWSQLSLNDKWSGTVASDYSEQWFMYIVLLPDIPSLPSATEWGRTSA